MNLSQLRNLVALAELSNFARAATAVHLSQPAFSRSIQAFEQELGVALVDRSTRQVHLTAFGKLVVERAKRILSEQKELKRDIQLMQKHEIGQVSFGAGPLPAAAIVVPMLSEAARQYPKLRIRAEFGYWQGLLEHLIAERLDFIIADIRELLQHPALSIIPLAKLHFRCFARPTHPVFKNKSIVVSDLNEFPLASVTLPKMSLDELSKYFGLNRNSEQLFQLECDNILVAEQVTMETDLILVAPYFHPGPGSYGRLVELELKDRLKHFVHFGVMELKHRTRAPGASVMIQAAQRLCKQLESSE